MLDDHEEGFVAPGVWGSVGSGILLDTETHVLLMHRSANVDPPAVLGVPGGQVPFALRGSLEEIRRSAVIEFIEECGSLPPGARPSGRYVVWPDSFPTEIEGWVARFPGMDEPPRFFLFHYTAPLDTPVRWTPTINWESDGFMWVPYRDVPRMIDRYGAVPGLGLEAAALLGFA